MRGQEHLLRQVEHIRLAHSEPSQRTPDEVEVRIVEDSKVGILGAHAAPRADGAALMASGGTPRLRSRKVRAGQERGATLCRVSMRAPGTALWLSFIVATASSAAAQPEPAVSVTRGAGAEECPDSSGLLARIEQLRGRPEAGAEVAYRSHSRVRTRLSARRSAACRTRAASARCAIRDRPVPRLRRRPRSRSRCCSTRTRARTSGRRARRSRRKPRRPPRSRSTRRPRSPNRPARATPSSRSGSRASSEWCARLRLRSRASWACASRAGALALRCCGRLRSRAICRPVRCTSRC